MYPVNNFAAMINFKNYIDIENLKPGFTYKIWARNAYIGIWQQKDHGFVIARRKMGPKPFLFMERHWDIGAPTGTAKPLEEIEKCPFELPEYTGRIQNLQIICKYLEDIERTHPWFVDEDTVQTRIDNNKKWLKRFTEARNKQSQTKPLHKIIKL